MKYISEERGGFMLPVVTVIVCIVVVIHILWIFLKEIAKGNNYNQNVRINKGRPVGDMSYGSQFQLMDESFEFETTQLKRPSQGNVTSSLAGVYVQLCDISTGRGYETYLEKELIIGRAPKNDRESVLVLNDSKVSQKHCRIYRQGEQILLQDLGSTNHTWLNGGLVEGAVPLTFGDKITVGQCTFQFQCYY